MKWETVSLAVLLGAGPVGVSLQAATIGFGVGHEVSEWILLSALAALLCFIDLIAEGVVRRRAGPLDVVQLSLQACYLFRRPGSGWNAGPVFESGLPAPF
jgi:hypothetical protein